MRKWMVAAFVAAMIAGAGLAPLPAQFGNVVGDFLDIDGNFRWNGETLDAPNTGVANNRVWLRGDGAWSGVGLADACNDLLTADSSTMSSAYQTLITCTVDVDEQGDRVLIDVTAQLGAMGAGVFVIDLSDREMWDGIDPTNPGLFESQGNFPAGLVNPRGATSHDGAVFIASSTGMWRCADPTSPGGCISQGNFPAGLASPSSATSHGGAVFVGDSNPGEMWRCADPTSPGGCISQGNFPAGLVNPSSATSHDGAVFVGDSSAGMWRCADPTSPGGCISQGNFPSGLTGPSAATSHGGAVFVADATDDEMWRCADPTSPGGCISQGTFPGGLGNPQGMTAVGDAPCDIRIARDTSDVETVMLDDGRIWLDAAFVDQPAPGSYTYSLQVKTSDPNTVCTAYRGDGSVPLPSLLVQVFYGS